MNRIDSLLSQRVRQSKTPDHGLRGFNDPDTIMFGGGLPDPATHPLQVLSHLMQEVLASGEKSVLGYGYEMGNASLRQVVAERANAQGASLSENNVMITNGCAGAIELAAAAFIDPGDIVLVEEATYPGALKTFRQMGGKIITVPMDAGGIKPDGLANVLQTIESSGQTAKILYTIASCQNPTATILSLERRKEILRLAEHNDFLVLQDNTYGDIQFSDFPANFITLNPYRTVHLGSFSKTIAPGLRMGWIASRPEIISGATAVRNDLGTSPLMQSVVARFFTDGHYESHLDGLIKHYRRKRDTMISGLQDHCGEFADWNTPEGGFFIWLRLRNASSHKALDAAAKEKVSFIPGAYFATDPGGLPAYLRLSYGEIPEDRIDDGLRRLGRALSAVTTN